jgi:DNA helicase HerA-like ATPase
MSIIGKVAATEKIPTTVDDFYFWTSQEEILNPFDVIKVEHINSSVTFGIIEEICHITDAPSYLTSFISNDFGDVEAHSNTERIGMNYIKAKVIGNTKNIYIPVINGATVSLANRAEVENALGLNDVKNPIVCGYIQMYDNAENNKKVKLPVSLNSDFLIGPEGAHLNISGISGLAAKTSYAMFLLKAIQEKYENEQDKSIAFIFLNVKDCDLLGIDLPNTELSEADKAIYDMIGLKPEPFKNVQYLYPYSTESYFNTFATKDIIKSQLDRKIMRYYKYIYEQDKYNLEYLLSNVDDPSHTMESIISKIINDDGGFGDIKTWNDFSKLLDEYCTGSKKTEAKSEIMKSSWNKFKRLINRSIKNNPLFSQRVSEQDNETRIGDAIESIKKNDLLVIDIARLDETMQGFVFGNVINSVYDLKSGKTDRDYDSIPKKIVIFVDELNKYASDDVSNDSPILRQLINIAERGRSSGIILFSAEQFRSFIKDRIKGNCATHAYGRTNAIEVSKSDYKYIPSVYKNMMTRLNQGEYILQNPLFRSVLKIKFPNPVYFQYKS